MSGWCRHGTKTWHVAVVVLACALVAVPAGDASGTTRTRLEGELTVSAAASLTEVFEKMATDFERRHPRVDVTFNVGSSSTLATQIEGGAPADVFASADGVQMQRLVRGGQVVDEPVDFTANSLTIVVKPGNPLGIRRLRDLSRVEVLSLCGETVPCGRYADQVLERAEFAVPGYAITRGQDVKATLGAVATGDADAAIVYATDAASAGRSVRTVRIPASLNVLAVYPIAAVAGSTNHDLAQAWIDHVMSSRGQRTLESFGFLPVPST